MFLSAEINDFKKSLLLVIKIMAPQLTIKNSKYPAEPIEGGALNAMGF